MVHCNEQPRLTTRRVQKTTPRELKRDSSLSKRQRSSRLTVSHLSMHDCPNRCPQSRVQILGNARDNSSGARGVRANETRVIRRQHMIPTLECKTLKILVFRCEVYVIEQRGPIPQESPNTLSLGHRTGSLPVFAFRCPWVEAYAAPLAVLWG